METTDLSGRNCGCGTLSDSLIAVQPDDTGRHAGIDIITQAETEAAIEIQADICVGFHVNIFHLIAYV